MTYQADFHTAEYGVVVCGGGLAGFSAAVAAARHGIKTCLVQDRPVLGGNSSSEIRVTVHGAAQYHAYARETGIVSEMIIEERSQNHERIFENGWTNSVWDLVLYDTGMTTPNLTLHLNTSIVEVRTTRRRIDAVIGRVANAEREYEFRAPVFIDCTGDGVVAAMSGCEWRQGSEARAEFGEPHAPVEASDDVMGSSIHFKARDMGRPVPFRLPTWAIDYTDENFFYGQGRVPYHSWGEPLGGYWWLEIGVPWHTIHENEDIRHELTRHALGVWNWIKNKDPRTRKQAENYALDWIGQVPGKRESRRIMGQYLMTEHDVLNKTVFRDEVAFGGWYVDLHTPGGLLAESSEPVNASGDTQASEAAVKSYCGPYGIPMGAMISKDIDNLMMAGRNISVTHAALGTVRVMGTTALMGQAVGTAAALAVRRHKTPLEICQTAPHVVQQMLLRDGCFLPNAINEDADDLARKAAVSASSELRLTGAGPQSTGWYYDLLRAWGEEVGSAQQPALLTRRIGQWIAIGTDRLDRISVCLTNTSTEVQTLRARLVAANDIWHYNDEDGDTVLAEATLSILPGGPRWVEWEVALDGLESGGYVRLDLLANPSVLWHVAGTLIPGHVAAFEIGPGKMRRLRNGCTMSFHVEPPQPVFGPENVLTGVTRPYRRTNLWLSDPADPLPQWLQLDWAEPQTIGQVQLTFPGHLVREYHAYPPLFRDPQCAQDYVIEAFVDGAWQEIVTEQGNYQRQRRHSLAYPVRAKSLRVTIQSTNGDPSAGLYEIRCYREG
ncbi:MAG: FAD-dependent oxidoreductase [Anaerolineae bacterium]|nr:FAD-dependent oxidoreductase [Anaerolineae bacterium]